MPARRFLAAALLALGLNGAAARADTPVVEPGGKAPASYAPLGWKQPDLSVAPGYWFSADQVVRIERRITYLEDKAARECVDAQIQAAKGTARWYYVAAGILTGAGLGYCAAASGHCGLYR